MRMNLIRTTITACDDTEVADTQVSERGTEESTKELGEALARAQADGAPWQEIKEILSGGGDPTKGQGLKAGEGHHMLALLEVVDVRVELLDDITAEDCAREGFPEYTPAEFCAFYRRQA